MTTIDAIRPLTNPRFIKPILIEYTQNKNKKQWEAITSHDSVSILLYHKEKDAFIIVKQLRPPVLNMNQDGYMYELCAGIVDKDLPLKQIAKEEVLEECGYDVPLENIRYITKFFTSVGISGAVQSFFYAQIDESMRIDEGGGIAGEEEIEVITLPLSEAKEFMFDESHQKTPGLMMGFYWFFDNCTTAT